MSKRAITRLIFLMILAFIIYCNAAKAQVEGKFQKYIDSFVLEAENRGRNIDLSNLNVIGSNEIFNDIIGIAFIEFNTIIIDTTHNVWICQPEALLFHELAHIFSAKHDDSCFSRGKMKGKPKSIMHPYMLPDLNSKKRKRYLNELFSKMII